MSDKPSLQDLLEVQKHFGLPSPALVEKDWYVVKALAALVAVDAAPFRLVFGGGTALSRAHRLIRRMSEDIDLKIISDTAVTRPALRHLRDIITKALLQAGFQFDPENPRHRESGNASRYTLYRLPYAPIMAGEGTLRPEIQIETAVWPLRRRKVGEFVCGRSFRTSARGRNDRLCGARRDGRREIRGTNQAGRRRARRRRRTRHSSAMYMVCTCSAGTMISLRLHAWHERSSWRMPQPMAINSRLTAQTLSPRPCGPLPALWSMPDLPDVMQYSSATWFMARALPSRLRSPRLRLWQKALRQ